MSKRRIDTAAQLSIANATWAAMIAPPPYVELANGLLVADTRAARNALLDSADPMTRDAALRYLAEPQETRERDRRLAWMREDPRRVSALRVYFRHNIADFICQFGT